MNSEERMAMDGAVLFLWVLGALDAFLGAFLGAFSDF